MKLKKLYLGTNLKMYKTISETGDFLKRLIRNTKPYQGDTAELFVIPSYTSLPMAMELTGNTAIKIGAQNMSWEEEGPFTGEISPRMLEEIGVGLVMVGHSERRHVFHETDEEENRKVLCAVKHGLTVLLCVGETGADKEAAVSGQVLEIQLKKGLKSISVSQVPQLWVAYEPVWAIGKNGIPASAEYAQHNHLIIKKCLTEMFGNQAMSIPVLYGGSVNFDNSGSFILQPDIDGLFIGRSAWDADSFARILVRVRKMVQIEDK